MHRTFGLAIFSASRQSCSRCFKSSSSFRIANREILHVEVTRHPTAGGPHGNVECCAWIERHREFLIHDRENRYEASFIRTINSSTSLSIGGRSVRRCVRDPSNLRATKPAESGSTINGGSVTRPKLLPKFRYLLRIASGSDGLQACVKLRGGSSRLRTCC
jgi:hypothetical protein